MRGLALTTLALIGAGVLLGLWLTRPQTVDAALYDGLTPDPANGALVFAAMGCASCHQAAEDGNDTELGGGKRFASPFGTFIAPNISPHPTHGIGAWSDVEIASAVTHGTGAGGEHLFPAFPYTSYAKASPQDITDLIAHLRDLPEVDQPNAPHEVGFPFNIRTSLGGWKLLFANDSWVLEGDLSEAVTRGRYLVEALAHCGECHTPRNALGGLQRSAWLTGGPNPSGEGDIPAINAIDWSDGQLRSYLTTGLTPDFDSAGGSMVSVIRNLAKLPEDDIDAIIAYLRKLP